MPILVQKKCLICGEKVLTGVFNNHLFTKHQIDLYVVDTGVAAGRIFLPNGFSASAPATNNAFIEVYSDFLKLFPGKSFNIVSGLGMNSQTSWLLIENSYSKQTDKNDDIVEIHLSRHGNNIFADGMPGRAGSLQIVPALTKDDLAVDDERTAYLNIVQTAKGIKAEIRSMSSDVVLNHVDTEKAECTIEYKSWAAFHKDI